MVIIQIRAPCQDFQHVLEARSDINFAELLSTINGIHSEWAICKTFMSNHMNVSTAAFNAIENITPPTSQSSETELSNNSDTKCGRPSTEVLVCECRELVCDIEGIVNRSSGVFDRKELGDLINRMTELVAGGQHACDCHIFAGLSTVIQESARSAISDPVLWFAGKKLVPKSEDTRLFELISCNERTSILVRLESATANPPVRQPRVDDQAQLNMLKYYHRRQEQDKILAEDHDDSFMNSRWADPHSLKNALNGSASHISWKI
jgi:hypothetical protein